MNRPTRNTLFGCCLVLLIVLFMATIGRTREVERLQDAANNFSHENLICSSYYFFVAQCMENKNPKDEIVAQYRSGAGTFLQRGIEMGRVAGVSDAAINAKVELAIEEMKMETDNNCINISVLFKKHAKQCKATYEDGPSKLLDDMNKPK